MDLNRRSGLAQTVRREEAAGRSVLLVAVGDRHARPERRFEDGPVKLYIDGVLAARWSGSTMG